MGFAAAEEPAGSDRIDCTPVGTSNDPYVFSSVAHGDPPTPLLKAYVGDPVVIRQVGLDEQVGDLRITGHRFAEERFDPNAPLTDAGTAGISEKMDYVSEGGAGGDRHLPGGNVIFDPLQSYGAAIGYDPDTTVAPGQSRLYSYYVDRELGTNLVLNMGNESSWRDGAYGALIAEPAGSTWSDPVTGDTLDGQSGLAADVHRPNGTSFREFTTLFSDREPLLGHDIMIYYLDSDHSYLDYNEQSLTQEEGDSLTQINLWDAKNDTSVAVGNGLSAPADPATPVFTAMAGDPVVWRVASAAGDLPISFQVAGAEFPLDHGMTGSSIIPARTLLAGETFDAYFTEPAGGPAGATGDYEYNVGRDPMIKSGMWGIFRVVPRNSTAVQPL